MDNTQEQQRKPSKQEIKKQQQYMERRQRLINQGIPENEVDMKIARDDYDALPVDKKLKRLEQMIQGLARGVSQDITNLIENDKVMADTYDINVRCIKRLLTKVGLDPQVFDQVASEVEAQDKARRDAQERAQLEAALAEEPEAPKPVEGAGTVTVASTPFVPEEATSFGG